MLKLHENSKPASLNANSPTDLKLIWKVKHINQI